MTYSDLQKALDSLKLYDRITYRQIKERYRELARNHHPDHGATDPAKIAEINSAYELLCAYCESFRFQFTEEEFYRQNPAEHLRKQFGADPVWSAGNTDDSD